MKSFKNIKIFNQLLITSLIAIIPVIILLGMFVTDKYKQIDITKNQIKGLGYIKILSELETNALTYDSNYKLFSITKNEQIKKDNDLLKASINQNFADLTNLDKKYSLSNSSNKIIDVENKWKELESTSAGLNEFEGMSMANDIRNLIEFTGNNSGLVLDTELDSYYLISIVLHQLPNINYYLYKLIETDELVVAKNDLDINSKVNFNKFKYTIDEEINDLNDYFNYSFENNKNIKNKLESLFEDVKKSEFLFSQSLNKKGDITLNLVDLEESLNFQSLGKNFTESNIKLRKVTLSELEKLLKNRINEQITYVFIAFFIVILILTFVGLLILSIIKGITNSIGQLNIASKMLANGDLDTYVKIDREDEIGNLAKAFNLMVNNIKTLMSNLKDEKNNLEAKELILQEKIKESLNLTEEIKIEKDSVEERIKNATKESERQKKYLADRAEKLFIAMERFSDGDLKVRLYSDYDDTDLIKKLFDGFNKTVSNIAKIVKEIIMATETITDSVEQIKEFSEAISSSTQEQSNQSGQVAVSIEQMTRTVYESASSAKMTSDAAINNGKVAKEGGLIVNRTIEKIREIAYIVEQSASMIKKLGESSGAIDEIVSVIDEIATQTNLLALNAAIEAARAGEQGKGFAVVADEVRKLAEKTTNATKEIARMIRNIQNETQRAVISIQDGTKQVSEGLEYSEKTGQALDKIVDETNMVVDMMGRIAVGTSQQSQVAESIAENIYSISLVSQQTANDIAKVADSTDDLSSLTENLQELMLQFKID